MLNPNDVMAHSRLSFAPEREGILARLEPGALGSVAVLVGIVSLIGYGAWSVLTEIQRVQFVPVEQAPEMVASLDPIEGAGLNPAFAELPDATAPSVTRVEPIDRLYRPQALDVPQLTPRDEAIATLDPDAGNSFTAPALNLPTNDPTSSGGFQLASEATPLAPGEVRVTAADARDEVILFAVRPSWIRVRSASGTTLFEGTLDAGDSFVVPADADLPTLRAGNSGSLYFAVNGVTMGPAGVGVEIARGVELTADAITQNYVMADANADPDLPRVAQLVYDDLQSGSE